VKYSSALVTIGMSIALPDGGIVGAGRAGDGGKITGEFTLISCSATAGNYTAGGCAATGYTSPTGSGFFSSTKNDSESSSVGVKSTRCFHSP